MPTITAHRVNHGPLTSYTEFATAQEAQAYRDANHPGAPIVQVTREIEA